LTKPETVDVMEYNPATSASVAVPKVPVPFGEVDLKKLYRPGFVTTHRITLTDPKKNKSRFFHERFEVLAATNEGYTRRSTKPSKSIGKGEVKSTVRETTWGGSELWPWPIGTRRGQQTITVKAGTFRCIVYHRARTDEAQSSNRTAYFSTEHPGLKVLEVDDNFFELHMRHELIELELGK